jgi:hypothetical protein
MGEACGVQEGDTCVRDLCWKAGKENVIKETPV